MLGGGNSMLDFVAKLYRGWVNFILYLILFGFTIIGLGVGGFLAEFRGFSGVYYFLGGIIGAFVGLIIAILYGGLIANFLNMVDNIKKQTSLLKKIYGVDLLEEEEEVVVSVFQNLDDKTIKLRYLTRLVSEPDKNAKFVCNILAGGIVTILEKKGDKQYSLV